MKLSPQSRLTYFNVVAVLSYDTIEGQHIEETYPLDYHLPPSEQFFSEDSLQEATSVFYFVHKMKSLVSTLSGQ